MQAKARTYNSTHAMQAAIVHLWLHIPLDLTLVRLVLLSSLALLQNWAWPPAAGNGDNSTLAGPMHYLVSRDTCTSSGWQLTGPMH
jgi:hypothetical protein